MTIDRLHQGAALLAVLVALTSAAPLHPAGQPQAPLLEDRHGQHLQPGRLDPALASALAGALADGGAALAGRTVPTTVDLELQQIAEQALALQLAHSPGARGAAAVLDPHTGEILAWVGGLERARPLGRALWPLAYLAGITSGQLTTATLLADAPLSWSPPRPWWGPASGDGRTWLGPLTVRLALAHSRPTPLVRATEIAGLTPTQGPLLQLLQHLGLPVRSPGGTPPTLDTIEASPLALLGAYAALASEGIYSEPHLLSGASRPGKPPPSRRALTPQASGIGAWLLQGAIRRGSAAAVGQALGHAGVAGQAGTNDPGDVWFIGFSRDRVAIAWLGLDPLCVGPAPTRRAATTIGSALLRPRPPQEPLRPLPRPASLSWAPIDEHTGRRAPGGTWYPFLPGTAPQPRSLDELLDTIEL